jgi:flagellar biosynthesis protein FliQ
VDIPQVVEIGRHLLVTALMVSLPALLASLVVGLIVSVFQALTSIQEQTLSFAPRLIVVGLVLFLCLGWMLNTGIYFTAHMFELAAGVVR